MTVPDPMISHHDIVIPIFLHACAGVITIDRVKATAVDVDGTRVAIVFGNELVTDRMAALIVEHGLPDVAEEVGS